MFKQYRKLNRNEFILCAVDTSSGGLDNTAAQFISKSSTDVPLVYKSRTTTADFIKPLSDALERIYDTTGVRAVVALERQNGGSFLMDALATHNRQNKYDLFRMPRYGNIEPQDAVKYGWDTNSASRPKMLQDLKEAIDSRALKIYDKDTIDELYSFVVVKTSSSWKAQAEQGAHDDLVMALAIAWQMYQMSTPPINNVSYQTIVRQFPTDNLFTKDGFY